MFGHKSRGILAALALVGFVGNARAEMSPAVLHLLSEMRETGSVVSDGVTDDGEVFLIAIGRSRYRPGAIDRCREIAEINAVKALSSALQTSFKSKEEVGVSMTLESGESQVNAFFSSLTEARVDSLLKGVQVIKSEKIVDGDESQMEVVVYTTGKSADRSESLRNEQLKWGDKGVVLAVGIDTDRAVAEKNALRSAVEQVAGTLVIGKVSVNEREDMHKRLSTTAAALVTEYRVVGEAKEEQGFRLEILARVDKRKLYDNYRSYFKCLGKPSFCLVSSDESLIRNFKQFFCDKGFVMVDDPSDSQYLIRLDGRFSDRKTPGNENSNGTTLSLNIAIVSTDGKRTLLTMNEKQSKDSEVQTAEQRREEVSRRIFNKLESRLHKSIQDMVIRMLDDADEQSEANSIAGGV